MSAFLTLATPMTDQECLLGALGDLGFGEASVEVSEAPLRLIGFSARDGERAAHVVLRRAQLGSLGDVGFEQTATGFRLHISDTDHARFQHGWLATLDQHYRARERQRDERVREEERHRLVEAQRQAIHERAKKMGYRVEEKREADAIRLVLVKRVY